MSARTATASAISASVTSSDGARRRAVGVTALTTRPRRPAALPVLKKQIAGVDRVFLGTDDPKTLTLESNQRLKGSGSARAPQGWQDFTFTCQLDPETGKVLAFTAVLTSASK